MSELLEVLGRAHPMVLHVPIGFFLALAVLEFFAPATSDGAANKARGWLVLLTALSTIVAVTTGLLHGRDPAFSGSTFELHRNLGLALVPLAIGAWWLHRSLVREPQRARGAYRATLIVGLGLLVPTGHFGAELTHGPGFLTEPLTREPPAPPLPPAPDSSYDSVIRPILDARCSACHGDKKQKGGLSLATAETITKGGRHGPVLLPGTPADSPMLQRIELALDDDKHMPPEDHDQLTDGELAAMRAWILAGAPFKGVVEGVRVDAGSVADAPVESPTAQAASLAAADPAAIEALRAALVHVQPESQDSPLLWVDFAAVARATDDAKAVALLTPIARQLCDVSLARTAVGDETVALLAGCENLVRADLRATKLSDRGLDLLTEHAKLTELVLAQNTLSDAAVGSLIRMPALERVHLWRSGLSAEAIARLRSERPNLDVDDGATPDSAALEVETKIELEKQPLEVVATAPAAAAPSLVPINAKCPVSGSPVKAQYSIVFEGRVIGFCCPNCPKEFWEDPAKFADRLN